MSRLPPEDGVKTLFETIVEHTLVDLASLPEWDEDSLMDLTNLLASPATASPESLMTILNKRDPRPSS